jgi:hypothetical protein
MTMSIEIVEFQTDYGRVHLNPANVATLRALANGWTSIVMAGGAEIKVSKPIAEVVRMLTTGVTWSGSPEEFIERMGHAPKN